MFKNNLKYPDFFIVGAPKCGTTAFDSYLKRHPDVNMLPKELHYWGEDIVVREAKIAKEKYHSLLKKHADKSKLLGEGAVWYLVSRTCAEELKKASPNSKILIFLRSPTEAAYSLYSNMVYNGDEPVPSFEEALKLQEERKTKLPDFYNCPTIAFQYLEVYSYYEQVKRYFDVFGKENVKVIIFEDFIKDKQSTYNEVLRFLGLTPHNIHFDQINPNKNIRLKGLRQFVLQPSPNAKAFFKAILPSKPLREKIKVFLWRINSKKAQRADMKNDTRTYLKDYFKQDIENLERFLEKNLSNWK